MAKKLRVAQVGIGGIGRSHFQAILKNERYQLLAVCDAYPERPDVRESMNTAEELSIPFFTDYRAAFRKVEADAAFVCTPHHWHAPMTIAALERGMHVFVEKPPAVSTDDARRMVEAQRKSGKVVTVGFSPITTPQCIALKNHIARGDLGEIREVVAVGKWFRADDYYRRADWVGRKKVGGKWCRDGVIYNQASHTLAAALMLANTKPGPTFSVGLRAKAGLYRAHPVDSLEMEDLACTVVELDGSSKPRLFFYFTTCNQTQKSSTWIKVFGEKGSARLGSGQIELRGGKVKPLKVPANLPSKHDNFYEAAMGGAKPYSPLKESVKVTYTIEAIYEAAGREIRKIDWNQLGDLSEVMERAAAQRCLFSEIDSAPGWA